MSLESPSTIEEWGQYIASLQGDVLRSKAIAANTLEFVQVLQDEGFEGQEIVDVLLMFALRLEGNSEALPFDMPGQYLSYQDLIGSTELEDIGR